ncbi:MAG: hydrogenase expression/formation protein HypE [Solirubrobacterales bacterium]|nr:hydrogenase expression/formation protein HypE [Solirubrobacterales bacterium]
MPNEVSEREQKVLNIIETQRAKKQKFRDPQITMAHGAGGKATQGLIEGLLVPAFANPALDEMADAGTVAVPADRIAMTTDSYVVNPIVFPGGTIGELAVNGTINDLAMAGAKPVALTLALILEEGLPAETLKHQVAAIAAAAQDAGVPIVAGDTKVVPRGMCDEMYICTSGVGLLDDRASLSPSALRPGDRILVSGRVGDHGTAIMLARGEFDLDAEVESDTQCLWPMVDKLLEEVGPSLRCLRDATRGGVASVLNELARASRVAMVINEAAVPVHPSVEGAAEILGLDVMQIANEGKLVAIVAPEAAAAALAALRAVPGGEEAAEIGECKTEPEGMVLMATAFGGKRVMDQLVGDPLPRIC